MRYECDLLVIGSGPGGSTAARFAAERGLEVLLVEKRQEVGSPVRCGEGISKIWLDEIGIQPDRRWIAQEIDGARIISPSGHVLILDASRAGNETGYVIERDVFDRHLAIRALRSGAEMWMKAMAVGAEFKGGLVRSVHVKCLGNHIQVVPKVVIAADGFESQCACWFGINTRLNPKDIESCLQYRLVGIEMDERYNDFYLGSFAPGGYVWVFSKGDGEANVGIGVQVAKIGSAGEVKRLLDAFISAHPDLERGRPIAIVAGGVSVCAPLNRVSKGNAMLVGDAARQVDPLTGGGVANACRAGRHAGLVAADMVESDAWKDRESAEKWASEYERRWRAELEGHLIRNYVAKEKASQLTDETFDKIVLALQEVEIDRITTIDLLMAIKKRYPDVLQDLEGLL